jgi:predicted MFS family arabinose efflux permease
VLPCTIIASSAALPFLFWNWSPWAGVALWGLGMGAIDSILRAGVSKFSTLRKRGSAYGAFNGVFGICWFAGSVVIGKLYEVSTSAAIGFGCAMQLTAALLFFRLTSSPELRRSPSPPAGP